MTRLTLVLATLATAWLAQPATAVSIGAAAPDFTLTDLQGKSVQLADFKGKYVVLEWVNPGCPFVQKHYNSGNMPQLQKGAAAQDVVWLVINSTKSSHQDYQTPQQLSTWLKEKGAAPHATMIDSNGKVGKLYEAKATPHMYVIDPHGTLIYVGAIDDKRSADPADVKTAKNFVKTALAEARAGKPVTLASTQAYGCAIKY